LRGEVHLVTVLPRWQLVLLDVSDICLFVLDVKWVFAILLGILGIMYMLFFCVSNKIAFLFMFVPVGLASVAYQSIPQAIVSVQVSKKELGVYIGVMSCFSTAGQQFSNFVIGMGGDAIWPNRPRIMIAILCVFAFLAALSAIWLDVPSEGEVQEEKRPELEEYRSDEAETQARFDPLVSC
jgi:sugar phosphate permease